jgi:hypothetical protein
MHLEKINDEYYVVKIPNVGSTIPDGRGEIRITDDGDSISVEIASDDKILASVDADI